MCITGPFFVLPTRKGSLGNLTASQVDCVLNNEEKWASISVFEATEILSPLSHGKLSLTEFCGLPNYKMILTAHNCFYGLRATTVSASSSGKVTISANHEKGKLILSPQKFMEIAMCLKPDCLVCPFEASPLCEPSERKRKTSILRSTKWEEEVQRELVAVETNNWPVNAFFCDTVVCSSSASEKNMVFVSSLPGNENLQEFEENLSEMVQHFSMGPLSGSTDSIPGPTFMVSVNSFSHFLVALKHGVTFIESSLPWSLAEKGIALVMPQKCCSQSTSEVSPSCSSPSLSDSECFSFLLDLNDHKYQLDITQLQVNCTCYTCNRHTKAYLHHLLTVQEMNSAILLSIHNLSVMVELSRKFRNSSIGDREILYNWLVSFL